MALVPPDRVEQRGRATRIARGVGAGASTSGVLKRWRALPLEGLPMDGCMRIAGLSTLLLATATAVDQASAAAKPADRAARISDLMLAQLVEAHGVPGMGAAVVRDGKVVWAGSARLRDVENGLPVDRHTIFRLASVSKLLTATAAAQLREQGRLDVDAPVQAMLPWLAADWSPITPRQLASHVS